MIRLVFRAESDGEVTAVYDEPTDYRGMLSVYAHMGQHANGSLAWYRRTRPATEDEYAPLLKELTNYHKGETIIVGKRLTCH